MFARNYYYSKVRYGKMRFCDDAAATAQDKHGIAYKGMASTFKRVAAEEGGKVDSVTVTCETIYYVTVVMLS
jgi:hypothetical protein